MNRFITLLFILVTISLGDSIAEPDTSISTKTRRTFATQDPQRQRYMLMPSALMRSRGEMGLFHRQLGWEEYPAWTSYWIGLSDFLLLEVGTVVPFWFNDANYNIVAGFRGGGELLPNLHIAGNLQLYTIPGDEHIFGLPSLLVTAGYENAHFTFAGGVPFSTEYDEQGKRIWLTLGANLRPQERIALITENWIITGVGENTEFYLSMAVRLIASKLSGDIGLSFNPNFPYPMPMMSIAFQI